MSRATDLVAAIRRDLAAVERRIRSHPWLAALEKRHVGLDALAAFAGEQRLIIASDLRSFDSLAARCDEVRARDFFLGMAKGEREALSRLDPFATAVGFSEPYEPRAACQAYPAFVAQLCRDGVPGEVAGAFLVNLDAWGANCARVRDALRRRYGLDEEAVAFFDFFATPAPGFADDAARVVESDLAAGVPAGRIARASRLLQEYELLYWVGLPI